MKLQLSSRYTFMTKYVHGPGMLLIAGAFAHGALSGNESFPETSFGLIFAVLLGVYAVFIILLSSRLKSVRVEDDRLYISDLGKQADTPLKNVRAVRDRHRWQTACFIEIDFFERTPFGKTVIFIADRSLLQWLTGKETDTLAELQQLVQKARCR